MKSLRLIGVLLAGLAVAIPSSLQAQQGGFRPLTATSTATLSVTSSSSSTNANGALQALITNVGSVEAFVAITGAAATAATTSGMSFPAGFSTTLQLNPGNFIAAITASSTTTLRVTFVSGTAPLAWAGTGGGGGGGGAVTLASGAVASGAYSAGSIAAGAYAAGAVVAGAFVDGWDVTQGAKADAVCTVPTSTAACSIVAILKALTNQVASSIPAGTALIGDVNLRQGGTALSATNGGFMNLLQGNAVIASGNPLFVQNTAGSAIIGKVGIDQTTPGTSNLVALAANQSVNTAQVNGVTTLTGTGATGTGAQRVTVSTDQATNAGAALKNGGVGVVNGASAYQHVAASATATVLGATGAAGDYLSHCVIYPTTTAAGAVTVFDNTNSAANIVIEFATGTLSNLAPIPIPVGAVSSGGAWKITTGTNVTVACFGKFT